MPQTLKETHNDIYQTFQNGDYAAAYAALEQSKDKTPQAKGEVYKYMAYSKHSLKEFQKAIHLYDQAIEHSDTETSDLINDRGICHYSAGNYKEAIADFDQLIERGAELDAAYLNKGLCLFGAGDYHAAIENLQKSLSIQPNNPSACYHLGWAFHMLDVPHKAIQAMRAYIRLQRTNADAYQILGLNLLKLSRIDEAIQVMKLALSLFQEQKQTDKEQQVKKILETVQNHLNDKVEQVRLILKADSQAAPEQSQEQP